MNIKKLKKQHYICLVVLVLAVGFSRAEVEGRAEAGSALQEKQERRHSVVFKKAKADNYGFRFAFYNVENLFDPFVDSSSSYKDFNPGEIKYWSWKRFKEKINNIYRAICLLEEDAAKNNKKLVSIGLAEVENAFVLNYLCKSTPLRHQNYNFVHFESSDRRGIDVALLYREDRARLIEAKKVYVSDSVNNFFTRDILQVSLEILDLKDTINMFVAHFPSKFSGAETTNSLRAKVGERLKAEIDKIYAQTKTQAVVAMGDFNAKPEEEALKNSLLFKSSLKNITEGDLVNLMSLFPQNIGSHKYREEWSLIDHILIKEARQSILSVEQIEKVAIFYKSPLLIKDTKYFGDKPFRSYNGPKYLGGFSDHLPVYVDVLSSETK